MSEIARYAVAWAEWRRALQDLISATNRLTAAAPDARTSLRKLGQREHAVTLNSGRTFVVGLRTNGDLLVREGDR